MIGAMPKGLPAEVLPRLATELEGVRAVVEEWPEDSQKIAAYVYERSCEYRGQGHDIYTRELIAEAIESASEQRAIRTPTPNSAVPNTDNRSEP